MRHLITSDGDVLSHGGTLASAEIADGAVLRLVLAHAAPPAPVVHDVTDLVADDLGLRRWRWPPAARRASAVAARPVAVAVAVLTACVPLPPLSVRLVGARTPASWSASRRPAWATASRAPP